MRAGTAVGTRSGEAFVDVMLAQRSDVPSRAAALEVVRSVDATAAVEARVEGTLVTVDLTAAARETRRTDTLETASRVQTRSTWITSQQILFVHIIVYV